MKVASTAKRIFDQQRKKTFATKSARSEHAASRWLWLLSMADRTLGRWSLSGRFDPKRRLVAKFCCDAQRTVAQE
jgi:hypothetical protein